MAKNKDVKRSETIIKFADHGYIKGLNLTVMLQSVTVCTNKAYEYGAVLISANSYPYISLEYIDGKVVKQPITLGN